MGHLAETARWKRCVPRWDADTVPRA